VLKGQIAIAKKLRIRYVSLCIAFCTKLIIQTNEDRHIRELMERLNIVSVVRRLDGIIHSMPDSKSNCATKVTSNTSILDCFAF